MKTQAIMSSGPVNGSEPGRNIDDSWYPEKNLAPCDLSLTGFTTTGTPSVRALFYLHGRPWREERMFGIHPYYYLYGARFECTYYQVVGRVMAMYTCFDQDYSLGPDNVPHKREAEEVPA